LIQIFEPNLVQNTNTGINTLVWSNLHKLKIQDGGGRHLGFRKMSITPITICAKIGGQMHHGHAEMTHGQKSKPELFLRHVIIIMNKDVYIKRMSGT